MAIAPGEVGYIPGDLLTADQYNTTHNTTNKLAIEDNSRIVFPGDNPPTNISDGHWVLAAAAGDYSNFPGISSSSVSVPSVLQYFSSVSEWSVFPLNTASSGSTISSWDYMVYYSPNQYVTYRNLSSNDYSFRTPFIYRCILSTVPNESPESAPIKWERQGQYTDPTPAPINTVFGRTGDVVAQAGDYSKDDIGLQYVDNTSDLSKPISNATQSALDSKIGEAPNDGNAYIRKDEAWENIDDVGLELGNLDGGDPSSTYVVSIDGGTL